MVTQNDDIAAAAVIKQIEEDSERDRYFSAEEAKDYGIVDDVLVESKQVKEK